MEGVRNILITLLSLVLVSSAMAAQISIPQQIEALLNQKRNAEAFHLAKANAVRDSGKFEFDLAYAHAMLAVGNIDEAQFALQRAAIQEPHHGRVLADLGLANYFLRNFPQAKDYVEKALATNPPPEVQVRLQSLLSAIERQQSISERNRFVGVEFKTGYDTNGNSATNLGSITIPVFGVIPLTDSGRAMRTGFFDINLSAGYIEPINNRWSLVTRGALGGHRNTSSGAQSVNMNSYAGMASLVYKIDASSRISLPFVFQAVELDGDSFKHLTVYSAEYSKDIGRNRLSVFADLRNDVNTAITNSSLIQHTAGTGVTHKFNWLKSSLTGKIFAARATAVRDLGSFNANRQFGIETAFTVDEPPLYKPYVGLSWRKAIYDGFHPLFQIFRGDTIIQGSAGIKWDVMSRMHCRAEYQYTKANSNIVTYDFNRHVFQAVVGYDFL